jgi:hypothetical protein
MINKNKAGLMFGAFLGLWHLLWSVLVWAGAAQPFLNWIFQLHFLSNPFFFEDFNIGTAALLITVTSVLGYIFGWALAFLWNALHKR